MAGRKKLLARGMTVQSRPGYHYAFCVICAWESKGMSFNDAREVATRPCPNKSKHPVRKGLI